jgi:hypothetical protein
LSEFGLAPLRNSRRHFESYNIGLVERLEHSLPYLYDANDRKAF